MKKVKVIWSDGSIQEINAANLDVAISRGAKLYSEETTSGGNDKKTTVYWADGSSQEIKTENIQKAIGRGASLKKKEDTPSIATESSNGISATSQSKSSSLFGGNNFSVPVEEPMQDAITIARDKGAKNIPAAPALERSRSPLVDDEVFTGLSVTLKDGTKVDASNVFTSQLLLPTAANKKQAAKNLQQKLDIGAADDNDVAFIAGQLGVIPELAKAKINNKEADIDFFGVQDREIKFNEKLRKSVEENNLRLGLDDSFEDVSASFNNTKLYLKKVEGINRGLITGQPNDRGAVDNVGGNVMQNLRMSEGLEVSTLQREIDELAKAKEVQRIADDPTKSVEEKRKEITSVVDWNNKEIERAEKARTERLNSPLMTAFGEVMLGNNPEEANLLNSIKGEVDFRLNNSLKNSAAKKIVELNKLQSDLQDKVNAGYIATPEDFAAIQKVKEEGYDKLKSQVKDDGELYAQYPSLLKAAVTAAMNDYKALTSGNLSDETNDAAEATRLKALTKEKYLLEKGFDINSQIVKDAINDDRTKDYDFLGGFRNSVAGVFNSTANSIGSVIGARDDFSRLADKRLDELFPRNVGKNDKYQLDDVTEFSQNVASTTGQVIGQAVLQAATGGIGRVAGLSRGAAIIKGQQLSGFMVGYDDALKESYDFIDNPLGRMAYAGLIGLANYKSERIFDEGKVLEPLVKPFFREIAQNIGKKGFTDEMLEAVLKKADNKIIEYVKAYGKNIGQEMTEEGSVSLFTDATKFIFGDPTVSVESTLENLKETLYQTATGMTAVGAVGAYSDNRAARNNSTSATLYNAALYSDEAEDAIVKGYEAGKYDKTEMERKTLLLNTAKSKIPEIKNAETVIGRELTRGEKELYVANLTAQSVFEEQKKNTESLELKARIDEKLSNLKTAQAQILDGEIKVEDDGTIISNNKTNQDAIRKQFTEEGLLGNEKSQSEQQVELSGLGKGNSQENTGEIVQEEKITTNGTTTTAANSIVSENAGETKGQENKGTVPGGIDGNAKDNTGLPTPVLKTALKPEEKTDIFDDLTIDEKIEFNAAKKAGTGDDFLLKKANDKITADFVPPKAEEPPTEVPVIDIKGEVKEGNIPENKVEETVTNEEFKELPKGEFISEVEFNEGGFELPSGLKGRGVKEIKPLGENRFDVKLNDGNVLKDVLINKSIKSETVDNKGVLSASDKMQISYDGKMQEVDMDFKTAAQKVNDNLKSGETGYIKMPDGSLYEVSASKKTAKLLPEKITIQNTKSNEGISPAKDSEGGKDVIDTDNVALNTEFLGNIKGEKIGSAIIRKEDGYYYTVGGKETKIPDQKRAEKAFKESKEFEKQYKEEQNAASEENPAIQKLETERDNKIAEITKPEIEITDLTEADFENPNVDSKTLDKQVRTYKRIKAKREALKELVDCIWK